MRCLTFRPSRKDSTKAKYSYTLSPLRRRVAFTNIPKEYQHSQPGKSRICRHYIPLPEGHLTLQNPRSAAYVPDQTPHAPAKLRSERGVHDAVEVIKVVLPLNPISAGSVSDLYQGPRIDDGVEHVAHQVNSEPRALR